MKSRSLVAAVAAVLLSAAPAFAGRLLYAPSEADDATFRATVDGFFTDPGHAVNYFDARTGTPTLAQLQAYDAVYTWANFAYDDNDLFGDLLAQYVDGGGRVILGVFTTYTSGNSLAGDIMGSGYSPVTSTSPFGTNHLSDSTYSGDGTVFHTGVNTYTSFYRDVLQLQGAGVVGATYQDGEIAVAYRPDFGVIYANGHGFEPLDGTGDWARLIANMVDERPGVVVPLPPSAAMGIGLLAVAGAFRLRRRKQPASI